MSNPWLPYNLAVEVEMALRAAHPKNEAFLFLAEDYCNIVSSIAAAGQSSIIEVKERQMRATAAFFKTLSKEVLLRRCEKIAALYDLLKRVHLNSQP